MDYTSNTAGHRTSKKTKVPHVPPAPTYNQGYNPYGTPQNPQLFQDTSFPQAQSYPATSYAGPNMANYGFPMEGFPGQALLQDPQFANMAVNYGQVLVGQGREMVDQKLEKYLAFSKLKYYFAVDTTYVLKKLALLIFPFTHSDWSLHYNPDEPVAPRFEINAPDLYIPAMAFVTYILVTGYVFGTQNRFSPEQLGIQASSSLIWLILEIVAILFTIYITRMDSQLKSWDLLAFCSYKYIGMILSLLTSLVFKSLGYFAILIYSSIAIGFFLVRTLRLQLMPVKENDVYGHGSKRRLYLLLFIALLQPVMMYWLTYQVLTLPPEPLTNR